MPRDLIVSNGVFYRQFQSPLLLRRAVKGLGVKFYFFSSEEVKDFEVLFVRLDKEG